MNELGALFRRAFEGLAQQSAVLLPRVLVAFVLFLLGVGLAFLAQAAVRGLLRRAGLDRLVEQIVVFRWMRRLGHEHPASHLAGYVAFWTVLAIFLLSGADALGLPEVSAVIGRLIAQIPPVALAILLLLIALAVASSARRTVEGVAERSRLIAARPLGAAVFWLVVALGGVVALSGIGVDFTIVTVVVAVTLAAVGTGFAVTLALGSRDVVRNTISGIYARRVVRVGDRVRVGEVEGDVEAVGQIAVTLRAGSRTLLVPYDHVVGSVLEIVRRGDGAPAA